MDDGTDPHPPTGRPPPRRPLFVLTTDGVVPLAVEEALDPRNWGSAEPSRQSPEASREQRRSRRHRHRRPSFPPPPPPSRSLPPVDDGATVSSRGAEGYMPQAGARERRRLIRDVTSSVASSSSAPSCSHSDHPGTRTHVRQSILYSDRPRRSRPRRPALAEECTREESSSELGNLPTIGALSPSDPLLLTPQTETPEESDDDCAWLPTAGQTVLRFNEPTGITTDMIRSLGDSLYITVSNDEEQRPKPYFNVDKEVMRREIKEYLDGRPCIDLSVACDKLDAMLNARAAKPPSVLTEQASVAVEREKTSTAWMNEEVMLCFKKLFEISPDLAKLEDYRLDELLHQCFNVESYYKVYHHYNFTVRMKMPGAADWTVKLYFAEVKEVFRKKYYLCYPLEQNENGQCYACKNQGVGDLRHPAIDLFETGLSDASAFNLWYGDD